jgi:hypothetical protein
MRTPAGQATDPATPRQPVHERVACELVIRRSCGSSSKTVN